MVTGSRRTQNGRERRAPAVVDAPPARSWLLPVVVMAAAFLMRLTPWSTVFFGDHVSLRGNDAGYHLRVIDHLIANFPHLLTFDPYAGPGGDRRLGLRPQHHFHPVHGSGTAAGRVGPSRRARSQAASDAVRDVYVATGVGQLPGDVLHRCTGACAVRDTADAQRVAHQSADGRRLALAYPRRWTAAIRAMLRANPRDR